MAAEGRKGQVSDLDFQLKHVMMLTYPVIAKAKEEALDVFRYLPKMTEMNSEDLKDFRKAEMGTGGNPHRELSTDPQS